MALRGGRVLALHGARDDHPQKARENGNLENYTEKYAGTTILKARFYLSRGKYHGEYMGESLQ